LKLVYQVHRMAARIKSDDAFTASIAENNRQLAEMAGRSKSTWELKSDGAMKRMLERMPADAEVMRQLSPEQAGWILEFYEKHRATYGL